MATARAPTSASSISIYAELLSNIRQVSVGVTLPTPSEPTTAAEVFDGGRRIKISHGGHVETLELPAAAVSSSVLPVPHMSSIDLIWRLPLATPQVSTSQFSPENQEVPWTSLDLTPGSPITCRGCDGSIIEAGRIQAWKDLPSENWAEMMEFWHCHKPHEHDQKEDGAVATKGYGANSSIAAKPGVGFVDLSSFMFSELDCNGLLFSKTSSDAARESSARATDDTFTGKFLHVYCKGCNIEVGNFNILASSVTLFKWQVSCETASPVPAPSGPECLAATLIASISRSAFAKSIVNPYISTPQEKSPLHPAHSLYLWVLNPNVVYSSSSSSGRKTSMKILYQDIDPEKGSKLTDSVTSDVQDISLPLAAIQEARETLKASSFMLPTGERQFKEWGVGLLPRWASQDIP